jgi:hypothetical protein
LLKKLDPPENIGKHGAIAAPSDGAAKIASFHVKLNKSDHCKSRPWTAPGDCAKTILIDSGSQFVQP